MIQDIQPSVFSNAYSADPPADDASVFAFYKHRFLAHLDGTHMTLPTAGTFWAGGKNADYRPIRLFTIDDQAFYLAFPKAHDVAEPTADGFDWTKVTAFRKAEPFPLRLAASTAIQLSAWYDANRFCGRCGQPMDFSGNERALTCPTCRNRVYPRINPAVIVAVRNGDSLLMIRYAGPDAYRHRALVAGFCEIGETAEQTVAREVMEEAGVRVKNIRYWNSQPWGFASDLLLGFVCDLDGSPELHRDEQELSSVEWVRREDIFEEDDHVSLTRAMVVAFKNGEL